MVLFRLTLGLLVALAALAYGQSLSVSCPGVTLRKVGCFNSKAVGSAQPKGLTSLIFTNMDIKSPKYSKVRINWQKFNDYIKKTICDCVKKRGSSPMIAIRNLGECRVGAGYAVQKAAKIGDCKTWNASPCKANADCIGGPNVAFVYTIAKLTTPRPKVTTKPPKKPTTKPGGGKPTGTGASTARPTTPSPVNLKCSTFSVKLKLRRPPPGRPGTTAFNNMKCSICRTIKTLYHCHPCFHSAHFVNTTKAANKQTIASIVLRFGCVGQHLKKLVARLAKDSIISAVCLNPVCPKAPAVPAAPAAPGCTLASTCPATPSCGVPSTYSPCSAPVAYPAPAPVAYPAPAPVAYPAPAPVMAPANTCPYGCSSSCAPNCHIACCRSKVRQRVMHGGRIPYGKPKAKKEQLYDYSLV